MSKTAPIPILDRTVKKCGSGVSQPVVPVTAIAKVHSCSYGLDSQSGVGNHYDLSKSVQKGSHHSCVDLGHRGHGFVLDLSMSLKGLTSPFPLL